MPTPEIPSPLHILMATSLDFGHIKKVYDNNNIGTLSSFQFCCSSLKSFPEFQESKSGNVLDSSGVQMRRGKEREVPKAKKPSLLRKVRMTSNSMFYA